jgi:hypothetical protein
LLRTDNTQYYKKRAELEYKAAVNARSVKAAELHRLMAFEYDKLIVAAASVER